LFHAPFLDLPMEARTNCHGRRTASVAASVINTKYAPLLTMINRTTTLPVYSTVTVQSRNEFSHYPKVIGTPSSGYWHGPHFHPVRLSIPVPSVTHLSMQVPKIVACNCTPTREKKPFLTQFSQSPLVRGGQLAGGTDDISQMPCSIKSTAELTRA
jgi:hypothetical protein